MYIIVSQISHEFNDIDISSKVKNSPIKKVGFMGLKNFIPFSKSISSMFATSKYYVVIRFHNCLIASEQKSYGGRGYN